MAAVLASVFVHLGTKRKLEHSLRKSRINIFDRIARSHTWDSQRPTRHPATALIARAVALLWGYLRLFLAKTTSFCYCSAQALAVPETALGKQIQRALCRILNLLTFRRSLTTLRQSATSWTVSLESR